MVRYTKKWLTAIKLYWWLARRRRACPYFVTRKILLVFKLENFSSKCNFLEFFSIPNKLRQLNYDWTTNYYLNLILHVATSSNYTIHKIKGLLARLQDNKHNIEPDHPHLWYWINTGRRSACQSAESHMFVNIIAWGAKVNTGYIWSNEHAAYMNVK